MRLYPHRDSNSRTPSPSNRHALDRSATLRGLQYLLIYGIYINLSIYANFNLYFRTKAKEEAQEEEKGGKKQQHELYWII